jgi:uncharacterized protein (DUF779 family)
MMMRAILILIAMATAACAEPLPVPKTGTCPSNYHESGGCCAPNSLRYCVPRSARHSGNLYVDEWEIVYELVREELKRWGIFT